MASKIDNAVQIKVCHAIDKVHKELSEEAIRHTTTAKMMYVMVEPHYE